jgi:hypothetical protein
MRLCPPSPESELSELFRGRDGPKTGSTGAIGVLTDDGILDYVSKNAPVQCLAARGGVVAMRPCSSIRRLK